MLCYASVQVGMYALKTTYRMLQLSITMNNTNIYTWTLKSTKKLERLEFQSVWATWSTSRQNWTVPNKTERQAFAFSMAACSCVKWAQVWHHRSAIRWFFSKLSISNCLAYWPRHFSRIYQTISANQGMNGTRTTFFGDTQLAKSFHGIP